MSDFSLFSKEVHLKFNAMQGEGELYVVDVDKDELFEFYLSSFPEGTNPIYRERTEHDCSCCKNFIRNLGPVVSIVDGDIQTVWGLDFEDLPEPYATVAIAMSQYIVTKPIKNLYRSTEPGYGAEKTYEQLPTQELGTNPNLPSVSVHSVKEWNHFHAKLATKYVMDSDTIGPFLSEKEGRFNVFKRGLETITADALQTVIDLVNSGSLYRGDESLTVLQEFQLLQQMYEHKDPSPDFAWQNLSKQSAGIRNTAIGTLLVDLSEGMELEYAVKAYEKKVAPENYKRSSALITPAMVTKALAKLDDLGLRTAIDRRAARVTDVSVNDVLFVDGDVQPLMRDALADLLAPVAKSKPLTITDPTEIGITEFMAKVLPLVSSMGVVLESNQLNNFMSLTAPVDDEGVGQLFKWDNNFSWSYNGDFTDSVLRQAVSDLGGRIDGVLRLSHMWNHKGRNASLMDLHVFMPGNSTKANNGCHDNYGNFHRVGWNHRKNLHSGGVQDVDYTSAAPEGYVPVENITFPSIDLLDDGDYIFKIHNWKLRSPTVGGFSAEIEVNGQVYKYEYDKPMANKEWVTLAVVTLKNGKFTIEHKLEPTSGSTEKWGVTTGQIVPVSLVTLSPNHWGESSIGNKHWFFILKDCKNPDPIRSFYNEYLHSSLHDHRKVFEQLGAKTKAPVVDDQLSGVGFSSTKDDKLCVVVKGQSLNKTYLIYFKD